MRWSRCAAILVGFWLWMPGLSSGQAPLVREVVSWASLQPTPVVPGSIFVIYGESFTRGVSVFATSAPLPTFLFGVNVQINGTAAPLLSVLPGNIVFQAPWELAGQSEASIRVFTPDGTSPTFAVPVAVYSPSIFEGGGNVVTGNKITVFHADLTPVTPSSPARIGETLVVYGIGFGPVNNTPRTGLAADPSSTTTTGAQATIGGVAAVVTLSRLAPGYVGLYEIQLQIPPDAPSGAEIPLVVSIGGLRANVATIAVESAPPTILLSQSGLLFTGVEGGPGLPSQRFGVLNTGTGNLNWTAEASTLSGDGWLSVSPSSGTSSGGSATFPTVVAAVSQTGLAAGSYSGSIVVRAPGAANSPQTVTVILRVLPRESNPGPLVEPLGLIFTSQRGGASPPQQSVRLTARSPGPVTVSISPTTTSGGGWLNVTPRTLSLVPGTEQAIAVQPTLGALLDDVYDGTLSLTFSDGSPSQEVKVLFVVTPGSTTASIGPFGAVSPFRSGPTADADCVPERLVMVTRLLGNNFRSPTAYPSVIEAQVTDDCGVPVPDATVVAGFSNGDPPLVFNQLGNGIYTATWRSIVPAAQVTMTVRAIKAFLGPAETRLQGQVIDNPTVPALFSGGTVNGASFARGEAVAPGSIITVFGSNLAPATREASEIPLPTRLLGTRLSVAGQEVPLFFVNNGQINAQLPFDLPASGRQQIVVRTELEGNGPALSAVPETITIVPAAPGIFTVDDQGGGAILHAETFEPVSESSPARPGEFILIFATGLGSLDRTVASGAPPTFPVPESLAKAQVTIADLPAEVTFSGLAPCCVALYQVNAQVPAGTPSGLQSLHITVRGAESNRVRIAVQ
jgi:uncharacterized protein (TIGR03437 family)